MIKFTSNYVCSPCGIKYGKPIEGVTTFHKAECGLCGKETGVCHQRNYGWFLEDKTKFFYQNPDLLTQKEEK